MSDGRYLPAKPGQLTSHGFIHGPANYLSMEQVFNGSKVKPAFVSWNIGNIGHPELIWLGWLEVKFWLTKFSATGKLCLEFVVALYFLFVLAAMPFSRIRRATRFLPQEMPCLCKALVIFGLP